MKFKPPAATGLLVGVLLVSGAIPSVGQDTDVVRLIRNLSAGDLSVLHGGLQSVDNQMMTTEGKRQSRVMDSAGEARAHAAISPACPFSG